MSLSIKLSNRGMDIVMSISRNSGDKPNQIVENLINILTDDEAMKLYDRVKRINKRKEVRSF